VGLSGIQKRGCPRGQAGRCHCRGARAGARGLAARGRAARLGSRRRGRRSRRSVALVRGRILGSRQRLMRRGRDLRPGGFLAWMQSNV
jgi:hypothetical protein